MPAEALVQQRQPETAAALRRRDGQLPDEAVVRTHRLRQRGADDLVAGQGDEVVRRVEALGVEQVAAPVLEAALVLAADLAERRRDQPVDGLVVARPLVVPHDHALGPHGLRLLAVQRAPHPPEAPGGRPAAGLQQRAAGGVRVGHVVLERRLVLLHPLQQLRQQVLAAGDGHRVGVLLDDSGVPDGATLVLGDEGARRPVEAVRVPVVGEVGVVGVDAAAEGDVVRAEHVDDGPQVVARGGSHDHDQQDARRGNRFQAIPSRARACFTCGPCRSESGTTSRPLRNARPAAVAAKSVVGSPGRR